MTGEEGPLTIEELVHQRTSTGMAGTDESYKPALLIQS